MILVCHVISQDHVIKGKSNIISRRPSRLVTNLLNLVTIGTVLVEICFQFVP